MAAGDIKPVLALGALAGVAWALGQGGQGQSARGRRAAKTVTTYTVNGKKISVEGHGQGPNRYYDIWDNSTGTHLNPGDPWYDYGEGVPTREEVAWLLAQGRSYDPLRGRSARGRRKGSPKREIGWEESPVTRGETTLQELLDPKAQAKYRQREKLRKEKEGLGFLARGRRAAGEVEVLVYRADTGKKIDSWVAPNMGIAALQAVGRYRASRGNIEIQAWGPGKSRPGSHFILRAQPWRHGESLLDALGEGDAANDLLKSIGQPPIYDYRDDTSEDHSRKIHWKGSSARGRRAHGGETPRTWKQLNKWLLKNGYGYEIVVTRESGLAPWYGGWHRWVSDVDGHPHPFGESSHWYGSSVYATSPSVKTYDEWVEAIKDLSQGESGNIWWGS